MDIKLQPPSPIISKNMSTTVHNKNKDHNTEQSSSSPSSTHDGAFGIIQVWIQACMESLHISIHNCTVMFSKIITSIQVVQYYSLSSSCLSNSHNQHQRDVQGFRKVLTLCGLECHIQDYNQPFFTHISEDKQGIITLQMEYCLSESSIAHLTHCNLHISDTCHVELNEDVIDEIFQIVNYTYDFSYKSPIQAEYRVSDPQRKQFHLAQQETSEFLKSLATDDYSHISNIIDQHGQQEQHGGIKITNESKLQALTNKYTMACEFFKKRYDVDHSNVQVADNNFTAVALSQQGKKAGVNQLPRITSIVSKLGESKDDSDSDYSSFSDESVETFSSSDFTLARHDVSLGAKRSIIFQCHVDHLKICVLNNNCHNNNADISCPPISQAQSKNAVAELNVHDIDISSTKADFSSFRTSTLSTRRILLNVYDTTENCTVQGSLSSTVDVNVTTSSCQMTLNPIVCNCGTTAIAFTLLGITLLNQVISGLFVREGRRVQPMLHYELALRVTEEVSITFISSGICCLEDINNTWKQILPTKSGKNSIRVGGKKGLLYSVELHDVLLKVKPLLQSHRQTATFHIIDVDIGFVTMDLVLYYRHQQSQQQQLSGGESLYRKLLLTVQCEDGLPGEVKITLPLSTTSPSPVSKISADRLQVNISLCPQDMTHLPRFMNQLLREFNSSHSILTPSKYASCEGVFRIREIRVQLFDNGTTALDSEGTWTAVSMHQVRIEGRLNASVDDDDERIALASIECTSIDLQHHHNNNIVPTKLSAHALLARNSGVHKSSRHFVRCVVTVTRETNKRLHVSVHGEINNVQLNVPDIATSLSSLSTLSHFYDNHDCDPSTYTHKLAEDNGASMYCCGLSLHVSILKSSLGLPPSPSLPTTTTHQPTLQLQLESGELRISIDKENFEAHVYFEDTYLILPFSSSSPRLDAENRSSTIAQINVFDVECIERHTRVTVGICLIDLSTTQLCHVVLFGYNTLRDFEDTWEKLWPTPTAPHVDDSKTSDSFNSAELSTSVCLPPSSSLDVDWSHCFGFTAFEMYEAASSSSFVSTADSSPPMISVDEYGHYRSIPSPSPTIFSYCTQQDNNNSESYNYNYSSSSMLMMSTSDLEGMSAWDANTHHHIIHDHFTPVGERLQLSQNDEVSKVDIIIRRIELRVSSNQTQNKASTSSSKQQESSYRNRPQYETIQILAYNLSVHYRQLQLNEGETEQLQYHVDLKLKDLKVVYCPLEKAKKVVICQQNPVSQTSTSFISVDGEGVDISGNIEYTVNVYILPLRCFLDTGMVRVVESILSAVSQTVYSIENRANSNSISTPDKHCTNKQLTVHAVSLKLDYSSESLNLLRLRRGDKTQLLSLFPLEGLEIHLSSVTSTHHNGTVFMLINDVLSAWREQISKLQTMQFLQGTSQLKGASNIIRRFTELLYAFTPESDGISFVKQVNEKSVALMKSVATESLDITQKTSQFVAKLILNQISGKLPWIRTVHFKDRRLKNYLRFAYSCLATEVSRSMVIVRYLLSEESNYEQNMHIGTVLSQTTEVLLRPVAGVVEAFSIALLGLKHQLDRTSFEESLFCLSLFEHIHHDLVANSASSAVGDTDRDFENHDDDDDDDDDDEEEEEQQMDISSLYHI